jgi:hypothetical protein
MRVVPCDLRGEHASGISKPGVKAAAFLSADGSRLVVHAANVQDLQARLRIDPGLRFRGVAARGWRTSAVDACRQMEPISPSATEITVELPARSMNTWEWVVPSGSSQQSQ